MAAHQPSPIARRGERKEEDTFFWKCKETAEISGSGPEAENPSYRFASFSVEFLLLPLRLETQQGLLMLPNGIFSMLASSLGKQPQKKKKFGRRWKQHFIFENIIKGSSGFSGLGKGSLLFLSHSETM